MLGVHHLDCATLCTAAPRRVVGAGHAGGARVFCAHDPAEFAAFS